MHQVGVERVVVGNEHGERVLTASTRAAHALHEGGTGTRPTRHEYGVQPGDVDAQFQCGGARQAEQFAVAEFAFEFAALFGGVPGAVCGDAVGEALLHLVEVALGLLREDFYAAARTGENQGAGAGKHQVGEHLRALLHGGDTARRLLLSLRLDRLLLGAAGALGELIVRLGRHEFGLPERDGGFTACGGGLGNGGDRLLRHADELGERLDRVGAGCGGAVEHGHGAVERADAAQAAQQVGDVCTENAAVAVRLVEHHVAQPAQEGCPLPVVAQD